MMRRRLGVKRSLCLRLGWSDVYSAAHSESEQNIIWTDT